MRTTELDGGMLGGYKSPKDTVDDSGWHFSWLHQNNLLVFPSQGNVWVYLIIMIIIMKILLLQQQLPFLECLCVPYKLITLYTFFFSVNPCSYPVKQVLLSPSHKTSTMRLSVSVSRAGVGSSFSQMLHVIIPALERQDFLKPIFCISYFKAPFLRGIIREKPR